VLGEDVRPGLVADPEASRKPLVTSSAVGSPRRSSSALVATVVPIFTAPICSAARAARADLEKAPDRLDGCVPIRFGILRQELQRPQAPIGIARHHVGEGAATVDPEIPFLPHRARFLFGRGKLVARRERVERSERPCRSRIVRGAMELVMRTQIILAAGFSLLLLAACEKAENPEPPVPPGRRQHVSSAGGRVRERAQDALGRASESARETMESLGQAGALESRRCRKRAGESARGSTMPANACATPPAR
jgi:hypothetical protein